MSEFVQEVQTDTVDLVVHVQTADVFAVVFHDYVDEVVDRCLWILSVSVYITPGGPLRRQAGLTVFITDQDLAVEDLIVSEDIGEHLLVEVLGRRLEGDFHSAGFLEFEVDVSFLLSAQ